MPKDRRRKHALPLLACLLLVGLSGSAMASPAIPQDEGLRQSRALLESRERELMHRGEPLEIVGSAQGDNDFRARTPALTHSDKAIVLVDPAVLYDRRLAMYEDGATFNSPPAPASGSNWGLTGKPIERKPVQVEAREEATEGTNWLALSGLGLLLVAGGVLVRGRLFGG